MTRELQVQSILYNSHGDDIRRSLQSMARATEIAVTAGVFTRVHVRLGDSSPIRCLSPLFVEQILREFSSTLSIEYVPFNANLGSAGGHNLLAAQMDADFVLIQNPDVIVSPRLFETLMAPFGDAGVGMVEAKQLPIEHPKEYDPVNGDTPWATTACAMIPAPLFRLLEGFDAKSFFLYCDDVDFSWRVRLAGLRVIFKASAVVFHDKRLSDEGSWQPTASEHYYSAEASMILAHKWSHPKLANQIAQSFLASGNEVLRKAAKEFQRREREGELVTPLDPGHKVGYFADDLYAKHRFTL